MKLNWINVENKKPKEDEEVFVLFGCGKNDDPHHWSKDEIIIGFWSNSFDDFLDTRHQLQFSRFWLPICDHYQPERLSEKTSKEDATV